MRFVKELARPTVVYCASGYRSSIAASVLGAAGLDDVSDLLGGYEYGRRGSERFGRRSRRHDAT